MNKKILSLLFLGLCYPAMMHARENSQDIEKSSIQPFLPPHAIIVEAGAHIGDDTKEMAVLWPSATIHAFEPVPALFNKLYNKTRSYTNVYRYQLALSNRTGISNFYVSSGASDGSSSLLEPTEHLTDHPDTVFQEIIEVQCVTLDDWARDNGIDHIDFLWLDLQGSELDVLKASPNILKTVKIILTEVSFHETYKGVPLYSEFRMWLEHNGFVVIEEDLYWPDMGNILCVRT